MRIIIELYISFILGWICAMLLLLTVHFVKLADLWLQYHIWALEVALP